MTGLQKIYEDLLSYFCNKASEFVRKLLQQKIPIKLSNDSYKKEKLPIGS